MHHAHLRTGVYAGTPAAAAPAAWTPAQLPSLAAWYTAGPTWCFTDAAGTVACGDGDLVRVWKDRSGNSMDLTQGTAGLRPTLALGVDGIWRVVFDGVNDRTIRSLVAPLSQPHGLAMSYLLRSTGTNVLVDNVLGATLEFYRGSGNWNAYAGTAQTLAAASTAKTVVSVEFNAASSKFRFNGGTRTAFSGSPGTQTRDGLNVGASAVPSLFSDLDVAEIVVPSDALSDANDLLLHTYLNSGWAAY